MSGRRVFGAMDSSVLVVSSRAFTFDGSSDASAKYLDEV